MALEKGSAALDTARARASACDQKERSVLAADVDTGQIMKARTAA
jgi:hypothetical protein